ncbi:MAG: hypothetical protein MMC23_004208 [Stictis urceolatum]|nr:hypothetical protein [Stictis urceolata]
MTDRIELFLRLLDFKHLDNHSCILNHKPISPHHKDKMSVPPAFSDIAKPSNDLLNKDFYHIAASQIEVKSKAPNGVNFNVKGKSTHEGSTSGSIEGKYTDAASGTNFQNFHIASINIVPPWRDKPVQAMVSIQPDSTLLLIQYHRTGLTLTQGWSTANSLDTKIELDGALVKGLKGEIATNFLPATKAYGARANLYYKQPNVHTRAFIDLIKGPTATIDATVGHEGFLVGAEAGYDVQKAAITRYSAAVGYQAPIYSAAVTATSNLSVFAASYYHKVNSQTEAGAKATWDSKSNNNVGLELATKYRLDPASFMKAKVNDRGIAALSYNTVLRPGFTLGLGLSLDTQKLNEASHKGGVSLTFEG